MRAQPLPRYSFPPVEPEGELESILQHVEEAPVPKKRYKTTVAAAVTSSKVLTVFRPGMGGGSLS